LAVGGELTEAVSTTTSASIRTAGGDCIRTSS
jgi:hypothetical protein